MNQRNVMVRLMHYLAELRIKNWKQFLDPSGWIG